MDFIKIQIGNKTVEFLKSDTLLSFDDFNKKYSKCDFSPIGIDIAYSRLVASLDKETIKKSKVSKHKKD